MRAYRIAVALLLLVLAAGAVSAGDITADDSQIQITQNDTLGVPGDSYTDLAYDINSSGDTFEIEHNYAFAEGDEPDSVAINERDDFTVNGNHFTLDAKNRSSSLQICNSRNVTINNLVLINANMGALVVLNSSVTLNNITFIDNFAGEDSGALTVQDGSEVILTGATFLNNAGEGVSGADVFIGESQFTCLNSSFTSTHSTRYGSVLGKDAYAILIDNCTFTNISSTYSPAILCINHGDVAYIAVKNSRFINLRASETAGAVAFKMFKTLSIENCLFENTSSAKNAGAIFIDTMVTGSGNASVVISNITCRNASSLFGGALVQLGSNLILSDSTFSDCSAEFDGGAVYLSCADAIIENVTFTSNRAGDCGGGLYFDSGTLNLSNCKFRDSSASYGGAACLWDSKYLIDNVNLEANGQHSVFSFFDLDGSQIGAIYGGDVISDDDLNNTFYPYFITGEGTQLVLVQNNIDLENLPVRFDLRDFGWISPVRDQGMMGSCWTFGVTAALESALAKATGIEYDLSEDNMQNLMICFSRYGSLAVSEGGFTGLGAAYALSWLGEFPSVYDTYDELGKLSALTTTPDDIHIQDMIFVPIDSTFAGGDPSLKWAILKYGAVAMSYCADSESEDGLRIYYNETTCGQFNPDNDTSNHAVAIVGWDDTYPRQNFAIDPGQDGAWIVRNSWGEDYGDGGYFYLSYSDTTMGSDYPLTTPVAFIIENTLAYNRNYQFDFSGINYFLYYDEESPLYGTPVSYENTFTSIGDDLVAAVGTYLGGEGVNYTVRITVNGVEALSQNGTSPYYGYHTIKLDTYVPVVEGDVFTVTITSNAVPISSDSRVHYLSGVSMTDFNGTWWDLVSENPEGEGVACIKAYTLRDDTVICENANITVDYGSGARFKVRLTTPDGHAVGPGEIVNFTINSKTYSVRTDGAGIAGIGVDELPGTYIVQTAHANQTLANTITVRLNPDTCIVTQNSDITVDYSGGSYFSVKVVSSDGRVAASGVAVTFKINGKTMIVKTGSDGVARILIGEAPGKYTLTTQFSSQICKNKVTVRHVLKAKKITVKKTSRKFTLKATLKINGKLQKAKTVKFKLNGKTYKVKTDKKGVAKKTLKRNVIKKLKKGKKYTVSVTYLKDTVKTTLKVR